MHKEDTKKKIINILNTMDISFMGLGEAMRNVGIKYTFNTEQPMPPHYLTKDGVVICNRRHAEENDEDTTCIGNLAVGYNS